jgi:Domain of unknown function (DUF4389)
MAVTDPMAPARFCTNCGRPRLGGARFCVGCGREFDVAAVPGVPLPEQFLVEEDDEPTRPYPVVYRAACVEHPSRAGTIFRLVLAIPHLVVWPLLAVVSTVLSVVGWLAVLVLGRLPRPIHRFQSATVVYVTRVAAYLGLVDDRFPPFPWQRREGLPVDVWVAPRVRMSRLRTLFVLPLSLPAVVTAFFFGLVAWLLAIGAWWAILFTGRMPRTIYEMQGLTYAFQCHTLAYVPLLLTDVYPWYETGPLALRRTPRTRNPEAGLPPTEGPAPGDRVTQDGQPGGFLPPPPQS